MPLKGKNFWSELFGFSHLVHSRHFGSFIQQQLHDLYVPHFCGFNKRRLSFLKDKKEHLHPIQTTFKFLTSAVKTIL